MARSKCGLASGLRLSTTSRKPISSSRPAEVGSASAAFSTSARAPPAFPQAFRVSARCFSSAAVWPFEATDQRAAKKRIRQNIALVVIILRIMLSTALLLVMLADDHSAGVEFYKQRQFSKTIESLERAVGTEKPG